MKRASAGLVIAAAALTAGLAAAGAQTPAPMPLMPPTAAAPPPPPPPGSVPSPLLTRPGPIGAAPLGPQPSYPAPAFPGPISQQELQAYRAGLIEQQRQLEREGVSPANPRYRDIQQQLNQLGGQ
jgi:hypothetical protein